MYKISGYQENARPLPDNGISIVRFPEDVKHWHLVAEYLKLRKEVFVDRKDWGLFHAEKFEFEQYDSFDTTYIIATQDGRVVAGARLRRTDQISGTGALQYSYMIRDACLGILPGLPHDLCDNLPPQDENLWELTRMVVEGPKPLTKAMLEAANSHLASLNAKAVMFLGSPAFLRMARMMGWPVQVLGPVTGNDSGRFQVFQCPVRPVA